tara:strand:+ start:715 stop:1089 length:375 start_codon:yes stop_codon:yes gene_type:complete
MERHFTKWSKEDDAVLTGCLEKGLSKAVIAQALGRTTDSVAWRATYIRKSTQRTLPVQAPAKKVEPAPRVETAPKPPEMPDTLLERVMDAERMVQQIPMLTLIAGAGAMMSFTTLVIVILAMFS